jgi:ATP-dependent RNA helicase RhlE
MEAQLPGRWFRSPVIETSFTTLGLTPELTRAVSEQGYSQPTPIQAQAIPIVLLGRDLLGAAQTGTGKTAGFMLPLLQRLAAARPPSGQRKLPGTVRALILTPTRELAAQVHESACIYGRHLPLRSAVIYGGVNIKPQIDELRRGVDILVATPGRLLDHVGQRTLELGYIETLVLDEADRMLDMGFIHDIRRILALLPPRRQNLLFSATFSDEIRTLAAAFLNAPLTVEVARRNTPAELVAQVAHPVAADRKRELLSHLVKENSWQQVLVFVRTKHGANRLAQQLLRDGVEADAIHGNKSQNARTRALSRFKDGELRVLVATDIAARGLDIEALPHVVNFDLPNVPEDYIHRIGRTGRAGSSGEAVSLLSPDERPLLAAIERLMKREVARRSIPGFEPGSHSTEPAERRLEPPSPRHGSGRNPGPRQNTSRRPHNPQGTPTSSERRTGGPPPPRRAAKPDAERVLNWVASRGRA